MENAVAREYMEAGITPPEGVVIQNPYAVEKVDFEKLKNDTIELAVMLTNNGYDQDVGNLLTNVFKGTRLSELTENETTINQLQVVLSTLEELKSKARL